MRAIAQLSRLFRRAERRKATLKGLVATVTLMAFPAPVFFGLALVVLLGGAEAVDGGGPDVWDGTMPKDVSPAHGIPAPFVQDVQRASRAYGVPMQFLAGEVMEESTWNPNAYADYGGSHAMGLMQFEPETWSGWKNPFCRIDEPDTDADRIAKYDGYGVNADGMYAPVGTPSRAFSHIKELYAECQARGNVGCTPYASPWDPADALMAGAKYLSSLYRIFHTWPQASKSYYGGSGADLYAASVIRYTYAYILDTPPMALDGGGYWPFGEADLSLSSAEPGWVSVRGAGGTNSVQSQFLPSLPIVAPASGTVQWKTLGGTTTITLPLPNGGVLTIRASADRAIKWMIPEGAVAVSVRGGDVVGFIDAQDGFEVSEDITSLLPGGTLPSGVLHPPGHAVGKSGGGSG